MRPPWWILTRKRDTIRLWLYDQFNLTQSTLQLKVAVFNQRGPNKPKKRIFNWINSLIWPTMQLHRCYWWHKGEGSCIMDLCQIKATMKPQGCMYWSKIVCGSREGLTGRRKRLSIKLQEECPCQKNMRCKDKTEEERKWKMSGQATGHRSAMWFWGRNTNAISLSTPSLVSYPLNC